MQRVSNTWSRCDQHITFGARSRMPSGGHFGDIIDLQHSISCLVRSARYPHEGVLDGPIIQHGTHKGSAACWWLTGSLSHAACLKPVRCDVMLPASFLAACDFTSFGKPSQLEAIFCHPGLLSAGIRNLLVQVHGPTSSSLAAESKDPCRRIKGPSIKILAIYVVMSVTA